MARNREERQLKNLAIAAVLALLFAVPGSAGTRSCTAGMLTLNICRATSDVVYCLPISTVDPDAGGSLQAPSALVADAFASIGNWQSPAACTAQMVSASICSQGQLGSLVPITKVQFADLQVRAFVMSTVRRYLAQQQLNAAQAAADSAADPDIGN